MRIDINKLDYNDQESRFYLSGVPFDGHAFELYDNGELQMEASYVDGYRDGVQREWFPSGKIQSEHYFRKNHAHGVATIFRVDGKPVERHYCEYGIRVRSVSVDDQGHETEVFRIAPSDMLFKHLVHRRQAWSKVFDG